MGHGTTISNETSKVISIEIFCSNLNKNVMIDFSRTNFSSYESECEMCGSHGERKVEISKCECGKSHDIILNSW